MNRIKRRISLLLSLIIVVSMCNINPEVILAAPTTVQLNYLPKVGLKETEGGIKEYEITKDAEEATFSWSIEGGAGKYELVYYTDSIKDNLNKTTKVVLGFDVKKKKDSIDDPNNIHVTAELFDDNTAITFTGYQYEFPYIGKYNNLTTGSIYHTDLAIPTANEPIADQLKELSLQLGNLKVRAKTDGKTIKVWTNQINKGYITDFALYYGTPKTLQSTAVVFPGLRNASISSIYLDGELKDKTNPIDATITDPKKKQEAGDRPGIKVEIERPKIRKGETYDTLGDEQAKNMNVALYLWTKLEPDSTASKNKIQLNFNLKGDDTQKLTGEIVKDVTKYAQYDPSTDKINIFIAKEDSEKYISSENKKYVVTWPALEESMVIGGELTLSGKTKVNIAGDDSLHDIGKGNVALDTGYTYLRYVPEQSNVGEVVLKITPYKYKGEVTYKVYVANATTTPGAINYTPVTDENTLLGEYKYTYNPSYPDRKLEISVPSGVQSIFLIKAELASEGKGAKSQEVYYNSQSEGIVVRPYTPSIREVSNIYVIPEGDTGVEAAGMDLIWSAPTEEKLIETLRKTGNETGARRLLFELALYNSTREEKSIIAVFEATLTADEKVKIKQIGHSYATVFYNEDKNQFEAKNVVLKDINSDSWEKIELPSGYESDTKYPTIDDNYVSGQNYKIPQSFYLSMRAILETSNGLKTSANESQVYPITLDKTTEVVPTPTGVSVEKKQDTTDVTIKFKDVKLADFTKYMLNPGRWILEGSNSNEIFSGKYEIVLYQANYLEGSETKSNDISDSALTECIKSGDEKVYRWGQELTTPASISIASDINAQTALRNGKVVVFTLDKEHIGDAINNFAIKDLDPNTSYYIRVRIKLDSKRTKNGVQEDRVDYSLFSKILGFTTSTVAKPIEPDEEVPPTPKDYTATAKDNSTAVLNWRNPDISTENPTALSYEIIRTTTKKLNDELLKRNIKASDIISQESAKDATLFGSSNYKIISSDTGTYYELIDDTLQPNTVYYYYIRTVYNGVYSDWIYQPVTTMNIDAPISLSAFNATKTTVDIGFLAKVPSNSLYGTFDFGIAIQSEEDNEWKTTLGSSLSTISGNTPSSVDEGYTYYAYRITGLTPGKRYNIKVCVIDKSKEMIDNKYQQSLYSNIVYIRTEYDQAQQDKEDKYKEYLDRFDKEVDKFRHNNYWTVEDGSTYKYRSDYLAADMGLNKEYQLVTGDNSNEANYYFPISILTKMNEEQITFTIPLGDEIVYIRPNTIDENSELFNEAQDLISANRLEDYYFKISVSKNKFSGTINNEEVISPKISVEMNIVYLKQEDILIEADILEALETIITDKRKVFIDKLENRLNTGKLDDDTLKSILEDVLADVEARHMKQVSKIIDRESKNNYDIDKLNKAILIVHNGDHTAVNGYYYSREWTAVEVLSVGNGFAIEATKLGSYIFTGQKPLIDTVPQVAPYQQFINQYQLTEFFKMDSYMLDVAVNKQQVYGALARVLGASKGTDYTTYLQSKGIKGVSKLTSNNFIRQDEAIYVIMQGYEVVKHRKVETIAIKNKQSVQNIGAFQPVYRQYVYAAVELKVVQPQDSRVLPSKQLTATELISMLYKMQS